jgi:hypothetical protein
MKYLAAALCLIPSLAWADPAPTSDEAIELAAIQNAMLACGAAMSYSIPELSVYCQIARLSQTLKPKLEAAVKAQQGGK